MSETAVAPSTSDSARDQSWVYFEGGFRRYADARLGIMTHALHYGTGCFEGIRAYWSEERGRLLVFRLPEHYERMRNSARILRMDLPLTTDEICAITVELLRRNQYRQDVYVRPICYKASEEIGVRLHGLRDGFAIYTAPFGAYVDVDSGIRCMVSSWRRVDDNAAPARSKCTGIYINSALAKTEAMENGFDEAIMLTHDGHVCEGSAENIFMVRSGSFITPPESDNILEGITLAGGFTDKASPGRVRVIRSTAAGGQEVISVDMNDVIKRGQRDRAISLRENDVVVVPESFF